MLSMVMVLSGCKDDSADVNSTETTAPATQDTQKATEPTTAATEPTTVPVVEYNAEDFVYTEYEFYMPYEVSLLTDDSSKVTSMSRLPGLKIDSADANVVNNEIINEYYNDFWKIAGYDSNYTNERMDYVCFCNDNILSLVIEHHIWHTSVFSVYNFDLDTGKLLSYDEVASLGGITMDDVKNCVADEIEAKFASVEGNLGEYAYSYEYQQIQNDCYTAENLNKTKCYYDENGQLMAVYDYYWIAGSGYGRDLTSIDAYI